MPALLCSDGYSDPSECSIHIAGIRTLILNLLDESVSSPEKAGVGGSIPSLATMFSITSRPSKSQFHSVSFQNLGLLGFASRMKSGIGSREPSVSALDSAPFEPDNRFAKGRRVGSQSRFALQALLESDRESIMRRSIRTNPEAGKDS